MGSLVNDLMGHLERSKVFGGLDPRVLHQLASTATIRRHRKGHVLYREGRKADELLVVLRGRLHVSRQRESGNRMHLRSLGPGKIVGWSLVAGAAHSADLVSGLELEVARIPGRAVRAVAFEFPSVALKMIASLGAIVGKLSDEIAELRYESLDVRLLKTIGRLCGLEPRLRMTQAELAEVVGATRENVARALRRLEAEGLVARGRGWVELRRR